MAYDGDEDDTETFLHRLARRGRHDRHRRLLGRSPLGKALTGAKEGDTVSYETPTGKTISVTLVSAKPFGS